MEGSCLCGSITVHAPTETEINVCHCTMCRRWSGGPLLSVHCGSNLAFSGTQTPVAYRSSEWAERGFCPTCGTHLFYHLLPTDEYALPVGLFRDPGFELTSQIFIDEKPGYYELANDTPRLTGEQVFAQFAEAQRGG
ncbi:MAG: GFA family protein [Pseudomonadota bacterium]